MNSPKTEAERDAAVAHGCPGSGGGSKNNPPLMEDVGAALGTCCMRLHTAAHRSSWSPISKGFTETRVNLQPCKGKT
jgi:hypothetical protein